MIDILIQGSLMFLSPIRQLQYLVALQQHLHFGNAARALHVTQSTLSTGIRELEKSLGVQLVERTNKCLLHRTRDTNRR